MHDAYIIAGVRTPIGKLLGSLAKLDAVDLGALCISDVLRRSHLTPDLIDEVIFGQVLQAGAGQAPARQAALKGGLLPRVAAVTVNKVCGSGLKAVMLAGQAIRLGDAQAIIAGGMESMTRAPFLLKGAREGFKYGGTRMDDAIVHDGLLCAFAHSHMGDIAEQTAVDHRVSREQQDAFALQSQQRTAAAVERGDFRAEIVPVKTPGKSGTTVAIDEAPRPGSTLEGLGKLTPAFNPAGTVTAGNASLLSDGAAALMVVSQKMADSVETPWKARIVASAVSGVAPSEIFLAPVTAVQAVLQKAKLEARDIDLFEINEAYAVQMLACLKELKLDPARVNVNGGAIALGHPIGASGARVLVTLLYALAARGLKRGLVSLCLGGGNAVAMIVELEE